MEVSVKRFAVYLGVSYPTALKRYNLYLRLLNKKTNRLTVFDIAKMDDVSVSDILPLL